MPFSRKFANDATSAPDYHRALYFVPREGTTNEQIITKIKEEGIASYLRYDNIDTNMHVGFNDGRIPFGGLKIIQYASCCAFTRNAGYFYLFPIHREELAGVGLNENDLLCWIKKFNDQKIGFNYLYFGEQEAPEYTNTGATWNWHTQYTRQSDNTFYWVGVPIMETGNILKPYLHWVALRYLWNNKRSLTNLGTVLPSVERLAYYNIPRITMMLHEDYNMSFLKAFLYAHAAHPWNYTNSMCYSDYMGVSGIVDGQPYDYKTKGYVGPCLNITKARFKAVWDEYGKCHYAPPLNSMLTPKMFTYFAGKIMPDFKGLKSLDQAYDGRKVLELFHKKDYVGFIKEIKDSYKAKKAVKTNEKKVSA